MINYYSIINLVYNKYFGYKQYCVLLKMFSRIQKLAKMSEWPQEAILLSK